MKKTTRKITIVEEMIKSISKENPLRQLLRDNKIAEVDKIYEINPYKRDGGRRGLIVDVQEKNADTRSKIMIDLKQGQPIINQVYDSLYDIGQDCSKRIIIYSNGRNELDKNIPAADYWSVNDLINNLQQYPLGMHFLEMNEDTFTIGPHYMHDQWKPAEELLINKVPTREQFMAEVFWVVYFDSFNGPFYEPNRIFDDGFRNTSDWGHLIYIDCSLFGEIQLYWDQGGVRFIIKQESGYDEYLKMILDYEIPALQKRYGSDAVTLENVTGTLPGLHIRYSNLPFDWLYTADPRQITEFAKLMHEVAWSLRWRIEERIDSVMKRESA